MKKITFLTLMLIVMIAHEAIAQVSVTLNVEQAGTLSTLIEPAKKYTITQLVLTGEINGNDLKYIHEMAGLTQDNASTSGSLTVLNLSGAKIIEGGDYYYRMTSGGKTYYYYASTTNRDVTSGTTVIKRYRNNLAKLALGSKIQQLYLPNTATEITEDAFTNCTQLTRVVIGTSAATIRKNSFYQCTGLTSITIPANVTLIETEAFAYCGGMKNFYVNSNNTKYAGSAGVLYNKSCTELHTYPWAKGATFDVPSTVTVIGESAFLGDSLLTGINLSSNLDAVNYKAFRGCTNLASVAIPNHTNTIASEAFYGCTKMTSLTLGSSLGTIGSSAFYGCKSIASLTINSVNTIGTDAFRGCTGMTSLTIGNSVKNIGAYAFYGCTGMSSLTIGNSVNTMGESVFQGCTGLETVVIKCPKIGVSAFNGCSNISSLTIANTVNSIGTKAFYSCSKIPSVTIPSSTTSIAESAFQGCTSMSALTLGDNLTSLGNNVFSGCSNLLNVVMPLSLEQTGEGIFRDCTKLNEVTIGANLSALKPYSFNGCSSLAKIHCHIVKPLSIVENVFTGVNYNTCNLYVPKGTYNDYWVAPVWGKFVWINEEYYEDPNADRIYIDNFSIAPAQTKNVEVKLQNQSHTCVGFQCDIQLPTGLQFVYDENNYDYVVKASRTSQYVVGSTLQSNGVLRVTGLSPTYRILSGTSGTIFSFKVKASDSFDEGTIIINNAKLSTGSSDEFDTYLAPATACNVTSGNAVPGDLNGDTICNAADVTVLYNCLLNGDTTYLSSCDVNGDGYVNGADVTCLYSIILGQ